MFGMGTKHTGVGMRVKNEANMYVMERGMKNLEWELEWEWKLFWNVWNGNTPLLGNES